MFKKFMLYNKDGHIQHVMVNLDTVTTATDRDILEPGVVTTKLFFNNGNYTYIQGSVYDFEKELNKQEGVEIYKEDGTSHFYIPEVRR